ncbi:MAG: arginase family protein [Gaiellales bacterium]
MHVNAYRLIVVPYELGRLRDGVGNGPERLLAAGAEDALSASGARVRRELVQIDEAFNRTGVGEVDACFELIRLVAGQVREAIAGGEFPVVLSGSCFAGVGVVAGLAEPAPAVVWFDAHSDFNSPDTSIGGYFDGMGLAVLTGGAWQGMLATVPGARPVPESSVVLAGARSFDPPEVVRLEASGVTHLRPQELDGLMVAVGAISPAPSGMYLHVDLDVLDSEVASVNVYAAPGGPNGEELCGMVDGLLRDGRVRAISLTAYDPAFDPDAQVPPIALDLLRVLAASLSPGP